MVEVNCRRTKDMSSGGHENLIAKLHENINYNTNKCYLSILISDFIRDSYLLKLNFFNQF